MHSKGFSRSLSIYSTPLTTPHLPFLYLTRTIVQPWGKQYHHPSRRRSRQHAGQRWNFPNQLIVRSSKSLAEWQRAENKREIEYQKSIKLRSLDGFFQKRAPHNEHENVFAKILENRPRISDTPFVNRAMTMTQGEQEIFEKLQNLTSKSQPIQETRISSDLFGEFPHDKSLIAMFDDIADNLDKQGQAEIERETQTQRENLARSIQAEMDAKAKARSILLQSLQTRDPAVVTPSETNPSLSGSGAAVVETMNQVRANQRQELRDLFSTVEHDTDLWRLLESHIFKEMRELDHILNTEQKQHTEAESNVKGKIRKKQKATVEIQNSSHLGPDSSQELLRKMTNIYGPALLYSIRLFRTGFPRSPYAMLLLPMIKKLGPISYVLAGSTAFYDELLYITWAYYRDLNGCANLLEEMISHNILADQRTAIVYEMASRTREEELGAKAPERVDSVVAKPDAHKTGTNFIPFGRPVKSFIAGWWQLQGNEAGWTRWTKACDRLIAMTRLEMQRKQDEQLLADQRARMLIEDGAIENKDASHLFSENQETAKGSLEPEIELISDEITEPISEEELSKLDATTAGW